MSLTRDGVRAGLMPFGLDGVEPLQEPRERSVIHLHHLFGTLRPWEVIRLEALHPQAESCPVPVESLDLSPVPAAEDVYPSGEDVPLQVPCNDVQKPVDALAHVGDTEHEVDFSAVGDHERTPRQLQIAFSDCSEKWGGISRQCPLRKHSLKACDGMAGSGGERRALTSMIVAD